MACLAVCFCATLALSFTKHHPHPTSLQRTLWKRDGVWIDKLTPSHLSKVLLLLILGAFLSTVLQV